MSKILNISVADSVFEEITQRMKSKNITNRSEFVEDLIRMGLLHKDE